MSAEPVPGINYSLAFACFESLMLVTGHLLMDNHPLARRPHKSPAHTVKDLGAGLSAFPLPHPAAPKCPREPTTIQRISIPSTPCRDLFRCPRLPFSASFQGRPVSRAAHLTAPSKFVNRPSKTAASTASRVSDSPRRGAHCAHAQSELEEVCEEIF